MKPYLKDPDFTLWNGDALDVLRELPDESVDCAATSPPFYGLRDYGVDGQIGLEASPDEWARRLVAVFAEVRRVLKPQATLWIECGDSYASGPSGGLGGSTLGGGQRNQAASNRNGKRGYGDAKPKDLLGQPWLLAFALRGPWYTGRIKSDLDRVWLAAMVDAEGCIHIHRRKAGTPSGSKFTRKDGTTVNYERKNDTFGVMVSVSNTNRAIIDNCKRIYGRGSTDTHEAGTGKQQRKQSLHRWTVTGDQARDLLRELYPNLVAKQHEARLALACPTAKGDKYQEAIKLLHNGSDTTLDGKKPEGMWEPGFYLRQAIIWSKSNAMPESATDRCTTAHSYVFLLSKSARYWFDAEAISEPAEWAAWGKQNDLKRDLPGSENARGSGLKFNEYGRQKIRELAGLDKPPQDSALFSSGGRASALDRLDLSTRGTPEDRAEQARRDIEDMAELVARGGRTTNGQKERTDERRGFDNRLERVDGRKNARSVWTIPTEGYPEAHFATWPQALVERILKAGCPEGGTVVDPFMGSGTTALVARKLGRRSIGIELNADYCELAAKRLAQQSLLAQDPA